MVILNGTVDCVSLRIKERSREFRTRYMDKIRYAQDQGLGRTHLSCGNLAHVCAASLPGDKRRLADGGRPNLAIVTAYNDMLSAHQPFATYPELIKEAAREIGATAQVAGGVPAMCDGVTQGQKGMELSLFSRDVIALSAAVALSHNSFDAAVFLGVCDKIVPGLMIAAATFGHLPAVFLPAGPMTSGLENDEKTLVRQKFAAGEISRTELLEAEMQSYHSPGTCTFYGTANSNQMILEIMGLHLPGASFVHPGTPLREALTRAGTRRALEMTTLGREYTPVCDVLTEKAFVNGIVGLLATGGSTNLVIHLIAMARAAGIIIDIQDFSDLSAVVPLMTRIYPNGSADVNHFHAAGGMAFLISELLDAGLLHEDVCTIAGPGLRRYTQEPKLVSSPDVSGPDVSGSDASGSDASGSKVVWGETFKETLNSDILRSYFDPFQKSSGLAVLSGNLGRSVIKTSALKESQLIIEAPAQVFNSQEEVKAAFQSGKLNHDVICVVRFQGPKANGMPELHGLMSLLGVLQNKGFKVALVTDGRLSGASGKIPAAIHISPEALDGGPIAKIRDGDILSLDVTTGRLNVLIEQGDLDNRSCAEADLTANESGCGVELFSLFRAHVGAPENGAGIF